MKDIQLIEVEIINYELEDPLMIQIVNLWPQFYPEFVCHELFTSNGL